MYAPRGDAQFSDWATQVKNVAFTNQVALGLTPAQFAQIEDAANDFAAALTASNAAKDFAAGEVILKDEQRAVSEGVLRELCQMILANPSVSSGLKSQLGLNVTPTPYGPVPVPTEFSALAMSNGGVSFLWNRNGNPSTTTFALEAKYGTSSEWVLVTNTTKTRLTLGGFTPGDQVTFRVTASRGGETSLPSTEVLIYPGSEAEPIFLAEAA